MGELVQNNMQTFLVIVALAVASSLPTEETVLVSGVDPSMIVPEPEVGTYDPHQDAVETVLAMQKIGKGADACKDLADATEKTVEQNVKQEQDLLDKLDRGQNCPKSGQSAVDNADSALQKANGEAQDASKALAKAQGADVDWGSSAFNSVTKGNCNVFYTSAAYVAAEKAVSAAKDHLNQKNGAVTALTKALAKAKEDQKAAIAKCQCDTYNNHNAARTTANDKVVAAETKAWTKAAHLKCVLNGVNANACKVPALPAVKAVQLANGVNAEACAKQVGSCGSKLSQPSKLFTKGNEKWIPCFVARDAPKSHKNVQCKTLVPQGTKMGSFGCWHYNGCASPFEGNCALGSACSANVQESTSYYGWGGDSHILVVCIPA